MKRYDRAIKIAYDNLSGELLDADEIFNTSIDAFQIRKKYHEKQLRLSCCECEQDLLVSGSKYDRLHFKHKPNHDYCILADGKLTPQEHTKYTEILKSKESDRHKELKNKIGELLKSVPGIDIDTISIDNKFIVKENGKRKPDVYCKFHDKEIVFEIQLSDLSLGYILSRYEFYKSHGMYLIWILDNFDIHNQGTLERDIKYLTRYENFFKLDDGAATFKLECEYKFPFLTDDNRLLTKWLNKSVSLNELKFDGEVFQAFFYDFGDNKAKMEIRQKQKAEEIKENEKKKVEQRRHENAKKKANDLIAKIADFRQREVLIFDAISNDICKMTDFEINVLNNILSFKRKISNGKPPLIQWIDEAKKYDNPFLEFILTTKEIELDINATDNMGRTPLQAIFQNEVIYKTSPILALFRAGYKLTKNDIFTLSKLLEQQRITDTDFYICELCNNLTDRDLVPVAYRFSKLLFIIESARQDRLITFNFTGNKWVSFANNAIEHYSQYWKYIESAFKHFGLWNKLILIDKKGTFQKKVKQQSLNTSKQEYDIDEVLKDLYPELEIPFD